MTKKKDKQTKEKTPKTEYDWLIGNLRYQRKLKKRIGDMWTGKQEHYLQKLETYAQEVNIEIPKE